MQGPIDTPLLEYTNVIRTRAAEAQLAQLRTGHCGLNHYLYRFKKRDDAGCEQCYGCDKETVEHFLLECPAYWEARLELKQKMGPQGMRLDKVLGDKEGAIAMAKYVERTGRLKEGREAPRVGSAER